MQYGGYLPVQLAVIYCADETGEVGDQGLETVTLLLEVWPEALQELTETAKESRARRPDWSGSLRRAGLGRFSRETARASSRCTWPRRWAYPKTCTGSERSGRDRSKKGMDKGGSHCTARCPYRPTFRFCDP